MWWMTIFFQICYSPVYYYGTLSVATPIRNWVPIKDKEVSEDEVLLDTTWLFVRWLDASTDVAVNSIKLFWKKCFISEATKHFHSTFDKDISQQNT